MNRIRPLETPEARPWLMFLQTEQDKYQSPLHTWLWSQVPLAGSRGSRRNLAVQSTLLTAKTQRAHGPVHLCASQWRRSGSFGGSFSTFSRATAVQDGEDAAAEADVAVKAVEADATGPEAGEADASGTGGPTRTSDHEGGGSASPMNASIACREPKWLWQRRLRNDGGGGGGDDEDDDGEGYDEGDDGKCNGDGADDGDDDEWRR